MVGIVPCRHEQFSHARRQSIVDEEFQADSGSGSSRSIADAAAKRRHSRISSFWRSGALASTKELPGSVAERGRFSGLPTTHPQRALRHKSLVPPCFVNQLLDRFAWSVNDRSRSKVSSFDGRHAQEKGRRPSRQGSARQRQSLSPHCRSQSPRSAERKSVIHVSGRFGWVKVNGQWLYKTRQIVKGRSKHPARWLLWRPNRRAQIPSALRSAKPIRWRIR